MTEMLKGVAGDEWHVRFMANMLYVMLTEIFVMAFLIFYLLAVAKIGSLKK
jgi:hypothetical protein